MRLTRRLCFRLPPVVLAACLLAFLAGCATLSVSHLESRPIVGAQPRVIAMKFWRFEFTGALSGDAYVIRGRATPVADDLPPWVDRAEEITFAAYLRDPAGKVLAKAEKSFPAMALTADAAAPFEFVLSPAGTAAGDYAISFGYRTLFGSAKARSALGGTSGPPPAGSVFFAGEGALLKQ